MSALEVSDQIHLRSAISTEERFKRVTTRIFEKISRNENGIVLSLSVRARSRRRAYQLIFHENDIECIFPRYTGL